MYGDDDGIWKAQGCGDERERLKVGYTWEAEVVRVPDEKKPGVTWWEARLNQRPIGRSSAKDHAKALVDWTIAFQVRNLHDGYVQIVHRRACWEGVHGDKPLRPYVR